MCLHCVAFLSALALAKSEAKQWSRLSDLNRPPTVYKTVALPDELSRQTIPYSPVSSSVSVGATNSPGLHVQSSGDLLQPMQLPSSIKEAPHTLQKFSSLFMLIR